jgi:hypothetical protein
MRDSDAFVAAGWDFVAGEDGPHDIWAQPEGGGNPLLSWQLPSDLNLPTFSGGTGELNTPYLISTREELNSIGHNPRLMKCHFRLTNDLDFAGIHFYVIGGEFYYEGTFDGDGHAVSNLTITGGESVAPFGQLGAGSEVRSLGVVDIHVTGTHRVGGLAAYSEGTIARCYTTGTIRGNSSVGGLVGHNRGTVDQCFSRTRVDGASWWTGGLVGYNTGDLINCYGDGAVSSGNDVGGLVGLNNGSITMSYSIGTARVVDNPIGGSAGGLVGTNTDRTLGGNPGTVTRSFWDVETSGQARGASGIGLTTAEMQTASTFLEAGWDFIDETQNGTDDIWWILEGQDYPRLWWELGDED